MNFTESDFRHIFQEFYPGLYYYASTLVDEREAKDIAQEAFVELWKRQSSVEDIDHAKALLYKIVYTRALNLIRHRNVVLKYSKAYEFESQKLEYYHPDHNDVIEYIENKELGRMLNACIKKMPEKRRRAFTLSYMYGMKNKEIADVMEVSVRTVDTHIYKALQFLRKELDFLNNNNIF
jgi:RNA polymerase sigma-70 factor (ECF subfamily)